MLWSFLPENLPEGTGRVGMGRSFEMSWEGSPNYRWVRMYRGQRYRVNCDNLGMPRTKDESYPAANGW